MTDHEGESHHIRKAPDGTFLMGEHMSEDIVKKTEWWPSELTKSEKIIGSAAHTWPKLNGILIEDVCLAKRDKERLGRQPITRRGITERTATTRTIAILLRRNGWTSEEVHTNPKTGVKTTTKVKAWADPNGIQHWKDEGIGLKANWYSAFACLCHKLLTVEQATAKSKALHAATWVKHSSWRAQEPGSNWDCRLCTLEPETQTHLWKCSIVSTTLHPFFDLASAITGTDIIVTADHRLLGLDAHGAQLPGLLGALHALMIKGIVAKFTAQELDDDHPKYCPQAVLLGALKLITITLRALQTRCSQANLRYQASGTIDIDGRWRDGTPLITGMVKGTLKVERNFALMLLAGKINAFEKNATTHPLPYTSPYAPKTKTTNNPGRQEHKRPRNERRKEKLTRHQDHIEDLEPPQYTTAPQHNQDDPHDQTEEYTTEDHEVDGMDAEWDHDGENQW